LKVNQLKDTLNNYKNQTKQLTEENGQLVERLEDLKKKFKDGDTDLKQLRDNI
jgi:predicted nuclease with TOPRIM domain